MFVNDASRMFLRRVLEIQSSYTRPVPSSQVDILAAKLLGCCPKTASTVSKARKYHYLAPPPHLLVVRDAPVSAADAAPHEGAAVGTSAYAVVGVTARGA